MNFLSYTHPVLSCKEAKVLESCVLVDEAAEWAAMKLAGQGIAKAPRPGLCRVAFPF